MKKSALTAAIIAAAMVVTPAAAKDSSRFNENKPHSGKFSVHQYPSAGVVAKYHFLPKKVIRRSLVHRGYRNINIVRFKSGHYIVRANGYRGLVRLRVDARTGVIVRRKLLKPYPRYTNELPRYYFHWRLH
ncbi:MAG: hypothetical protein AAFR71_11775 [Pseudomonadota bacterium]